MGSQAERTFDPADIERLAGAREVRVVTRRRDGSPMSATIWVVVVDGDPYVRSYRGRRGGWWRRLLRDRRGALRVGGDEIPVVVAPLGTTSTTGSSTGACRRPTWTSTASRHRGPRRRWPATPRSCGPPFGSSPDSSRPRRR
jgi:hypothetical protein